MSNDPRLVSSQALAKAQDLEARLNAIIPAIGPEAPSIMYSGGTTIVTQSANGSYVWTAPAGVTSALVECWGAGAGGDGGDGTHGGAGGGGGEYASELYTVVPGHDYNYYVGNGGSGGTSGHDAADGEASSFDLGTPGALGVFAFGGSGSTTGVAGGVGGHGSTNSVVFAGGTGGLTTSTGGSGGGSSASPAGTGSNGTNSTTSSGSVGGSGGTDKGAGGGGGSAGANGTVGTGPGGGGGGAGAATGTGSFSKDYYATGSATYFGSDAIGGNANQFRNSSFNGQGTMTQGGETASGGAYNGTMKALWLLDSPTIQADLTGVTITKVTVRMKNEHSWYNSGMFVILGYANFDHFGSSWNGTGTTGVKTYWYTESSNTPVDVTNLGLGGALKNGTAKSITLGNNTQRQMDLYNYGYFFGASSDTSQAPKVHVEGNTGGAGATAGNGADGRVRITYSTSGVLVGAVQPASGTDDAGNAFAAGYTGIVTAIQPSSSPAIVEGWHSFAPLGTGFNISGASWNGDSPYADYKLLADGSVKIRALINVTAGPGGIAWKALTSGALPAGYRPSQARYFCVAWSQQSIYTGTTANASGGAGVLEPSGAIQVSGGANTAGSPVLFLVFEATIDLT